MKKIISIVGLSGLLLAQNSIELNVGSKIVEVQSNIDMSSFYSLDSGANYLLDIGFLTQSTDDSDKNTKEDLSNLYNIGLKAVSQDSEKVSFGIGMDFVASSNYNDDAFLALPLTLNANIKPIEKVEVDINIAYAPKILSFSKAESFSASKITVNYELLTNGHVFAGARKITTRYTNIGKLEYDNSLFVGYKISF